jgi:hypothetical protein
VTTLDDLLRGRRARRLSKLQVDEVSSVDAAANPGARVVLMKRSEESNMAAKTAGAARCPHCGHAADVSDFITKAAKGDATATDVAVIQKAAALVHRSIAEKIQAENPGMSLATAMAKAADTAEMSEMHRQERRMRLGPGY